LPKLRDKQVIQEYGMFYIGLKDDAYYWDILISNLRKVLFITIITFFLPNASSEMIVSYYVAIALFRIITEIYDILVIKIIFELFLFSLI
jgi:hypothetical protein